MYEGEQGKVLEEIKQNAARMKRLIHTVEKLSKKLSSKDLSVPAIVEAQKSFFELKKLNMEVRSLAFGMYVTYRALSKNWGFWVQFATASLGS